jgi:DNA-binding NtrC family response regulator
MNHSPDMNPLATQSAGDAAAMVVRAPAMADLLRRIEHVAPSNATVLILGESGTGKELIAAHLHRSSARRDGPYVVLNCAAIQDSQLESALFGEEPRAFPGAASGRVGKFEAANGGTLLLDEIGEMDPRVQAKLLRVLQQREIDRVGGSQPIPLDVRIVATTSRNLQEEVRLRRFRADLFFRLNVVTVKVPPLRERPADVPALAARFAADFARVNNLPAGAVSPDALAILLAHRWPGNVRELENVIHRAVLNESSAWITPAALEIDTEDMIAEPPSDAPRRGIPGRAMWPTAGRTIEAVEKDMILDALRQCEGNRGQTAAVLGISIRTLRNKLQLYRQGGPPGASLPEPSLTESS